MKCTGCGAQLAPNEKRCSYCGTWREEPKIEKKQPAESSKESTTPSVTATKPEAKHTAQATHPTEHLNNEPDEGSCFMAVLFLLGIIFIFIILIALIKSCA